MGRDLSEVIVDWFYARGIDPLPVLAVAAAVLSLFYLRDAYKGRWGKGSALLWDLFMFVSLLSTGILALVFLTR